MPARDAEDEPYVTYLATIVGARILGVSEEADGVWFYLSDGNRVEFFADPDGGFGVEIHTPGVAH